VLWAERGERRREVLPKKNSSCPIFKSVDVFVFVSLL
jgi:hypothetical protein